MAAQREWFDTDYYKVLGVPKEATEKELTRAYRKLAKQYHPDANPGSEDRFKEISGAYDVLGDETKRKEYDEVRRQGMPMGGFPGGGGQGSDGFNFQTQDLSDLFGGIFRQGGNNRRRGPAPAPPQQGADLETSIELSFDDAIAGAVVTAVVATHVACPTCHGSGSKPGTQPVVCPRCGGSGSENDGQNPFSLPTPCIECHGRGTKIVDPCTTCFGTGKHRTERNVKVRIPAGVEDRQRIRVKNRGEVGLNGGPRGDLYVVVHVIAHPVFGRKGHNLLVTVPVSFPEAVLGATVTVPSLTDSVSLKIPPGTTSGKTFRVKGRGISHGNQVGDLLVKAEVVVPTEVNAEQKAAIEALAKVTPSPRSNFGV